MKNKFLNIEKIRYFLYILLVAILFSGCAYKHAQNYNYKWKVKVIYTNGDIDTIQCERNSFNGNEAYLWLKISEPGILISGGTSPCLITQCGFYEDVIVCGVRKYEVLLSEKIPVEGNKR
jgi:hypothetical protein